MLTKTNNTYSQHFHREMFTTQMKKATFSTSKRVQLVRHSIGTHPPRGPSDARGAVRSHQCARARRPHCADAAAGADHVCQPSGGVLRLSSMTISAILLANIAWHHDYRGLFLCIGDFFFVLGFNVSHTAYLSDHSELGSTQPTAPARSARRARRRGRRVRRALCRRRRNAERRSAVHTRRLPGRRRVRILKRIEKKVPRTNSRS